MKLSEISKEQIEDWIKDVDGEYGGRYTLQYKNYFDSLKPEDNCEPYIALRNIKQADLNYQENIKKIIQTRKNIFSSCCCD